MKCYFASVCISLDVTVKERKVKHNKKKVLLWSF